MTTRTDRLHDRVRVEYRTDRVAWVVLEPGDESMNSFTAPVVDAMREGVAVAAERARVVVLRGEGGFAVGADLRHLREQPPESRSEVVDDIVSASNELVTAIRAVPALVVAAVTGVAAGGGFGFALACDLVVAHEEATFDAAYARIGLTPDNATPFFLARLLGPYRAREVLFSPDPLSAEEARDFGLVSAVYDGSPAAFDDQVAGFVERFTRHPPSLVGETKALVDSALETSLDEHLALEREAVVAASGTDRFAEGIDAFFDRRDPDWA
ncbi:enoyl-CoA hydratase [Salinigranum rubrum]|uniref:Enoyl-CoA hydratase n=1 Tax=Salinigranum rubrum TaxID=755307 RepID=A0A2I8VMT9_9EURY|nr:enoyl-CoA hydratase-related protein [Salinigranum rubrum]AUV83250.1 enoyl-CoA hydratase [Salinigranum rubrum]